MAPHFKLPWGKKKKKIEGSFTWFETSVNGGAVVLSVLKDAASLAPLPYLRNAAATTLTIIQIAQTVKDNKADFRRLCEDAATLTAVVYESRQRSEDPDGWPGAGLKDAVDNFLETLNMIREFAQAQVNRRRIIRIINSAGDGNKIREFRERLGHAMSQFAVSSHLQSSEILRLIKNMLEDYQIRLAEPVAASEASKEERAAELEARKKEQEAVNEKLQQIFMMLKSKSEPSQPPKVRSSNKRMASENASSRDAGHSEIQTAQFSNHYGPNYSQNTVNHHNNTVNDNSRHTTNYGGYTNYGQHAQGGGQINNYGPQSAKYDPLNAHRQHSSSNKPNYTPNFAFHHQGSPSSYYDGNYQSPQRR